MNGDDTYFRFQKTYIKCKKKTYLKPRHHFNTNKLDSLRLVSRQDSLSINNIKNKRHHK